MAELIITPGSPDANSYVSLEEAQVYFQGRASIQAWDDADSQASLLIMATSVIDMVLAGQRTRVDANPPYYRVGPKWTGTPTDPATQALAWPRIGMYNRNNYPIAVDVIPKELKNATAEMAGQLAMADVTLDNTNALQGITSAKAGSVSVTFGDSSKIEVTKMIPNAVLYLLVPSWYTDEYTEAALSLGSGGTSRFEVYTP